MKTKNFLMSKAGRDLMLLAILTIGVSQMSATTIASWGKVAIPTSSGPTASGGDANNSGTATVICSYNLNQSGAGNAYYCSSTNKATVTISSLNLSGYKNIKISFYSRASNSGTLTLTYSSDGSNYSAIVGNTASVTSSEGLKTIEGIPSNSVKLKLSYSQTSGSFYFGTITISGDKISTGECTAGAALGIAPGDVLVAYNSTNTKEMSSFTTGYVNAASYSGTPAGTYPLTVEAGSSAGTLSFKTKENKYLRMTAAANNSIELSTTKDAAASWTVTMASGVATITNSYASYSSYKLLFNTTTKDRFSSYTGTGNVSFYRYCASTYTVTYDANGATDGDAPTDASSPYDPSSTVTVLANTGSLVKDCYTFTGWNTAPGGGGTHYAASGAATFTITSNTTLYAEWTAIQYSVTWKVNGLDYTPFTTNGTGTDGSSTVNCGTHVSTLPTAPAPGDYCGDKFMGWTDAAGGTYVHGTSNLYTTASGFPNATGDQTFYAVFADYAD